MLTTTPAGIEIPSELRPALRELLVADHDWARDQVAAFADAVDHLDAHGRWRMADDDLAELVWDRVRHPFGEEAADDDRLLAAMEERPVDEVHAERLADATRQRRGERQRAEVERLKRHWFWGRVDRIPDINTGGWRLLHRMAERRAS